MKNETLAKFDLKEAVAIITGGAGLLGQCHAEAILDGHGQVALLDINEKTLESAVKKLEKTFGPNKVLGYKTDITDEKSISKTLGKIEKDLGPVSILINNAANNPKVEKGVKNFSRLENFPLDNWNDDVAVGLTGAFLMSKIVGQKMAERSQGVILNIASDLGIVAPDQRLYRNEKLAEDQQPVKPVTYSVVKHGLIGLTKYLATYWSNRGVRANAVAFGGVYNNQPDEFVAKLTKLIPLGRMAQPDEYKAIILFLCSDASSYMTGSTVVIDGGRTCW